MPWIPGKYTGYRYLHNNLFIYYFAVQSLKQYVPFLLKKTELPRSTKTNLYERRTRTKKKMSMRKKLRERAREKEKEIEGDREKKKEKRERGGKSERESERWKKNL